MKIYSVTEGYIDYLQSVHKHVYSNKEDTRVHTRKYIGIVVSVNNFNYYIPLSSPKEGRDYEVSGDGQKKIRKDSFTIFRITSGTGEKMELKGTIQFACMIPVPDSELELYDVENETDERYKHLVQEEIKYLRKNEARIVKRAWVIYRKKTKGSDEAVMKNCLDFGDMEKMCASWQKFVR